MNLSNEREELKMNYAVLELEKEIREKRKAIAREYLKHKNIIPTQVCEKDLLEIYAMLRIKAELVLTQKIDNIKKEG